jgi:hypothetical protein
MQYNSINFNLKGYSIIHYKESKIQTRRRINKLL